MRIEEVADGINNVDDEYTDFQLSKYPFIGKVFDDGFYWGAIETIKEIDERMYFKFKSNNVNEVAILALYAGEKPLGAIGISFCGQKVNSIPEKSSPAGNQNRKRFSPTSSLKRRSTVPSMI